MTTHESASYSKGSWTSGATDADFRAWGAACQNVLDNIGLTQVSSSTNWATTTIPTTPAGTFGANDVAVYKFNDSQSSTLEVYIKFEWGRGNITNAAAGHLALRVSVSETSSFTNVQTQYLIDGSSAADTGTWAGSFSDGCFVLINDWVVGNSATVSNAWVTVERSRSTSGAISATGMLFGITGGAVGSTTSTSNIGWTTYRLIFSPTSIAAYTPGKLLPDYISALTANTDYAVPMVWWAKEVACSTRSVVGVRSTGVGVLAQITVSDSGSSRTYRTPRSTSSWNSAFGANNRPAYRWE